MTNYSQYGEQAIILEHTPETGRFLDIGAFDPFLFSNTRALFEKGWSGIMVEPSPGPMRKLLAEYGKEPRIKLVQAAVSVAPTVELLRMDVTDYAVSTSNAEQHRIWKDHQEEGGYIGSLLVGRIALETLLIQPFDFVNIDAEGSSAALFLEMLKHQHPGCVCVEHDGKANELALAAKVYGYQFKANDVNLILWR